MKIREDWFSLLLGSSWFAVALTTLSLWLKIPLWLIFIGLCFGVPFVLYVLTDDLENDVYM